MHDIKDMLQYNDGKDTLPDGAFRISPSQIGMFFAYPRIWYENQFLNKNKFLGNSGSVKGTGMHAVAEKYAKDKVVNETDVLAVEEYIGEQAALYDTVEEDEVLKHWKHMGIALVNYIKDDLPTHAEDFKAMEIMPNIWLGGSIDAYNENTGTVTDYKSYGGGLSAPKAIKFEYKIQLLAYAMLYRNEGYQVNTIRIIYVTNHNVNRLNAKGKPLPDYPAKATELTLAMTPELWEEAENAIQLIADTVTLHKAHPEYIYLLYKSMALKENKELPAASWPGE